MWETWNPNSKEMDKSVPKNTWNCEDESQWPLQNFHGDGTGESSKSKNTRMNKFHKDMKQDLIPICEEGTREPGQSKHDHKRVKQ